MQSLLGWIPAWFQEWFQLYAAPFLKLEARKLLMTLLHGVLDTLLFIGLPVAISLGSQSVWNGRYNFTPAQQQQIEAWAAVSSAIAYIEGVPPVVPLVLWFKESGLVAENPANCEGLMGLYTAVKTGQLPCFPPGPVDPWSIATQLQLGARTFKTYCPEVNFNTTDPALLKRCYLYYNAGPRARSNPDQSAYVMNNYSPMHQNMVHRDIEGRTYDLKILGAWPAHLAIQAQLTQHKSVDLPPFLLAPLLLTQEGLDKLWLQNTVLPDTEITSGARCRTAVADECFGLPHPMTDATLSPQLSPLLITPETGQIVCGLLPGVELLSPQSSVVLAPLAGTLTRYTDDRGHLAVQIENDGWNVWLIGLRSYAVPPGSVEAGTAIGAVSGRGGLTPTLRYVVYDKIAAVFVDPLSFLPVDTCPAHMIE